MKEETKSGAETFSLVSLKCFLFFFFGGAGALSPFLWLHARSAGLTAREARVVSAAAPLVALPGAVIAALLLDRRSGGGEAGGDGGDPPGPRGPRGSGGGKRLRFLLAFAVLGAALCYAALLVLPPVTWLPARRPSVSFSCTPSGAAVLQEPCMEPACYDWPEREVGPLILTNCEYDCSDASRAVTGRLRAHKEAMRDEPSSPGEPPHICVSEEGHPTRTCHVYTGSGPGITVNASLQPSEERSSPDQWCYYPVAEAFSCAMPTAPAPGAHCRVLCDIQRPYTAEGSVLAQTQCQVLEGDPTLTFWSYLAVRCVADAFSAGALVLAGSAVVLATRGHEVGVDADLGRQLSAGLLGAAVAAPLGGLLSPYPAQGPAPAGWPPYGVPLLACAACAICAALILVFSSSMPVGVQTLAVSVLPVGRTRSSSPAGWEAAALFLALSLLGVLSSAVDSHLPWRDAGELGLFGGLSGELLQGLAVLVGALLAIPLVWKGEALVRYCGHNNLLITAFTLYIVRYTGLCLSWGQSAAHIWGLVALLALEGLSMFTLTLVWLTGMLYVTHLLPRSLTASGQALVVAAHFCIGRCLGALLGAVGARNVGADTEEEEDESGESQQSSLYPVAVIGAVGAAVVAVGYFLLHHCCGKARARGTATAMGDRRKGYTLPGQASNGSYTPLRVYHNGNSANKSTSV